MPSSKERRGHKAPKREPGKPRKSREPRKPRKPRTKATKERTLVVVGAKKKKQKKGITKLKRSDRKYFEALHHNFYRKTGVHIPINKQFSGYQIAALALQPGAFQKMADALFNPDESSDDGDY